MKQKIFIIIIHFNSFNDTDECLESISKILCQDLEIIIVDNTQDGSGEKIKEKWDSFETFHWIKNERNLGFAGGNNVAIRYALQREADCIFLLNNDTIVENSFVESLASYLRIHHDVGIVAPKLLYYSMPEKFQTVGDRINLWTGCFGPVGEGEKDLGQFDQPEERDYVTGAALMISKKCIERIGLLDESFFLYSEEVDWCIRARRAGFKVMYLPYGKVLHKVSASTSKASNGSDLRHYYHYRNKILLMRKHAHFFQWCSFMPIHLFRASRDIFRAGLFSSLSKAIVNGIASGLASPIGKGVSLDFIQNL